MNHDAVWIAPEPLHAADAADGAPALLRFTDDRFMESVQATLRDAPERLPESIARFETWRDGVVAPEPPTPEPAFFRRLGFRARRVAASLPPAPAARPPKLYQPAHQRHYLVTAQLVCATVGFPDRVIDRGRQEEAGFVLRRLLPAAGEESASPATWDEYAFVAGRWQPVAAGLAADEEILPLFPLHFRAGERPRRLLAGVVPVGRREAYLGAATQRGASLPESGDDARLAAFDADVAGPWQNLLERVAEFNAGQLVVGSSFPDMDQDAGKSAAEIVRARRTLRDQLQTGSWYVLLDLLGHLEKQLPEVWKVVTGQTAEASLAGTPAAAVWTALKAVVQPGGSIGGKTLTQTLQADMLTPLPVKTTLVEALQAIAGGTPYAAAQAQAVADGLEGVRVGFDRRAPAADWPDFLFPLADPQFAAPLDAAGIAALRSAIAAALPPLAQPATLPTAPLGDPSQLAWFRIRCVFRRPACEPLHAALLSAPSPAFEMAGFFDPDAPARPVRIGLPIDPTPAGLRKFDKKTFLVMSDLLCGQVGRFKKLTLGDLVRSVLPWPLHKDLDVDEAPCPKGGPDVGMVCSLSIPIVTICALILLMIIVSLLDFIFRWLPWFFMCLPIPGLKGKK